MSNKKEPKNSASSTDKEDGVGAGEAKPTSHMAKLNSYLGIIISILTVVTLIVAAPIYITGIKDDLKTMIGDLSKELYAHVGSVNTDLSGKNGELDKRQTVVESELGGIKESLGDLKKSIDTLDARLWSINSEVLVIPNDKLKESLTLIFDTVTPLTSSLNFSKEEVVGTYENGESVTFGDLGGVQFYTNYDIDGNDYWFYGSINESGYWDGLCVINVYNNDQLIGLLQITYDNGKAVGNYESISYTFDRNERINEYVYNFNERIPNGKINVGTTYTYLNVLLPEDKFKSEIPIFYSDCVGESMVKYYNGQTSNGEYNDSTGNAFYISYEDDKARLFYQGGFINGVFVDTREVAQESKRQDNSAFMIVLGIERTSYYYYIGSFSKGVPTNKRWSTHSNDYRIDNPTEYLPERDDIPSFEWASLIPSA